MVILRQNRNGAPKSQTAHCPRNYDNCSRGNPTLGKSQTHISWSVNFAILSCVFLQWFTCKAYFSEKSLAKFSDTFGANLIIKPRSIWKEYPKIMLVKLSSIPAPFCSVQRLANKAYSQYMLYALYGWYHNVRWVMAYIHRPHWGYDKITLHKKNTDFFLPLLLEKGSL